MPLDAPDRTSSFRSAAGTNADQHPIATSPVTAAPSNRILSFMLLDIA